MDFKFSYKFTDKAEEDLSDIIRYMRDELLNPTAAASFFSKIFGSIDNLRSFPLSGMLTENELLQNKDVRRVVVDNYIMYYLANEAEREIIIVRIVYAKRNLEDIYRSIN